MIETKGIVLREIKYGETSKIIRVFTEDIGKISILVRGAYRPKSKYIANTQIFSLSDFQLSKGKNFFYIIEADLENSYYDLREDIIKLSYGYYLLEMIDKSIEENQQNSNIFFMLIKTLSLILKGEIDLLKLITAYELKYISFLGFRPNLNNCTNCQKDIGQVSNLKFNLDVGGVLCNDCFSHYRTSYNIDIEHIHIMNKLLLSPLDKLYKFKIDEKLLKRIHFIMTRYILYKIERDSLNSLDMLNTLI